ncbi:hypothetical protein P171DRAFT_4396 [Karstenula rhodostoma CBS 690.94]|uniref:F-box domain-containing protein n=1 Tax=Karstenula rhodostoma CBS 690.94 TaxID=1392251 RepID=A0A9P4PY63_9PLEO|nr:hypothetical protein P171DRAFT_4396 [Karstenula rhodostoma CBS 690.94]
MIAAPATPGYARPTAAWKARITSERSRVQYTARPRPKRPSRLLLIRPHDPSRPCYFSCLPRELRLQVYEYILPQYLFLAPSRHDNRWMKERFKPALLHVCGLVRLEVAALLYGSTHITYYLSSFQFRPFGEWLTTIPKEHVTYLAKNRNLKMYLDEDIFEPVMKDMVELCERFGNRYLIPKGDSYKQFIKFCQLARWTQWCGDHSISKKLHWNYSFELGPRSDDWEEDMFLILKSLHSRFDSYLWTIANPTIQNAWKRDVRKRTMKRELQKMLESIDKAWMAHCRGLENLQGVYKHARSGYSRCAYDSLRDEWATKVANVREIISSW